MGLANGGTDNGEAYRSTERMDRPMDMVEDSWFTLTLDPDGTVFSISKSFDRSFGRSSADLIGRRFKDLVSPPDWSNVEASMLALSSSQTGAQKVQAMLKIGEGRMLPFELSFVQLTDGDAPIAVNVLAKAIHRPGFQETKGDVEEFSEEMIASTTLRVISLDSQGIIGSLSGGLEADLGASRHSLDGRHVAELLDTNDLETVKSSIAAAMQGWSPLITLRFRKSDGGRLDLPCRMMHLKSRDGASSGFICVEQSYSPEPVPDAGEGYNLEVLAEASTDLLDAEDFDDSIDRDLDKLVESLGIEYSVFRLLLPDGKPKLVCSGLDFKNARRLLESRVMGSGQLYKIVQDGEPFISLDIRSDPRIIVEEADIRSMACLPIRHRHEIYGSALFASGRLNGVTQGKLPVLQVFCNQVAIAVRRARLQYELERRTREHETLYETSMALSGSLDYHTVLGTILAKATELVQADNAYLFVLDKRHKTLRCMAEKCEFPDAVRALELKVGEGITGLVAQSGEGMLIERADLDSRSKQVEGTPDDPSSLISVPLKMGDEVLGVVTLEKIPGIPFTKEEYRLIEMFTVQAATAVKNAIMFNQINEQSSAHQMYNVLLTHDVANYNVPIHGYLEMLAKDPKVDERQRRFVLSALAQSENISNLISDVRKLTALRTLTGREELRPIDLVAVVRECIDAIHLNTLYEEHEIRFPGPQVPVLVQGDSMVKDMVHTLMVNVVRYGKRSAIEVEILPYEENGCSYWRLNVKDRGNGIPEGRKAFLFKRFEQVDMEAMAEGHGIGLSV
ncbi:MAG TPA: GAF domain-containing protein, partial [Methanomassiliicoccales archaeon]|nr:GAF domain-containing protein [Methanomassiliicoccales archaeon]